MRLYGMKVKIRSLDWVLRDPTPKSTFSPFWSIKRAKKALRDPYREQDFRTGNTLMPCSANWQGDPVCFPPCKEQIHPEKSKHVWVLPPRYMIETWNQTEGSRQKCKSPAGYLASDEPLVFFLLQSSHYFIGCPVLLRPSHTDSSSRSDLRLKA